MKLIGILFIGWILDNGFEFSQIFSQGVYELFGKEVGIATYYLIFFVVGLILEIIEEYKR